MKKIILSLLIFLGILFGSIIGAFAEENCTYKTVSKAHNQIVDLSISEDGRIGFVTNDDSFNNSFVVINGKTIKNNYGNIAMFGFGYSKKLKKFIIHYISKDGKNTYIDENNNIIDKNDFIFGNSGTNFYSNKDFKINNVIYSSTNIIKNPIGTGAVYEIANSKGIKPYRAIYKDNKIISSNYEVAFDFSYSPNGKNYVYFGKNNYDYGHVILNGNEINIPGYIGYDSPIYSDKGILYFVAYNYKGEYFVLKSDCGKKLEENSISFLDNKVVSIEKKLLQTKNGKKIIEKLGKIISNMKKEKLKKVSEKLKRIKFSDSRYKKYKLLLEYINYYILLELKLREIEGTE